MLRVNNNNIKISRGDSGRLVVNVFDEQGNWFVVAPPTEGETRYYAIAFIVQNKQVNIELGKCLIEKYMVFDPSLAPETNYRFNVPIDFDMADTRNLPEESYDYALLLVDSSMPIEEGFDPLNFTNKTTIISGHDFIVSESAYNTLGDTMDVITYYQDVDVYSELTSDAIAEGEAQRVLTVFTEKGLSIFTFDDDIAEDSVTGLDIGDVSIPEDRTLQIGDLVVGINGGVGRVTSIYSGTFDIDYFTSIRGPQGEQGETGEIALTTNRVFDFASRPPVGSSFSALESDFNRQPRYGDKFICIGQSANPDDQFVMLARISIVTPGLSCTVDGTLSIKGDKGARGYANPIVLNYLIPINQNPSVGTTFSANVSFDRTPAINELFLAPLKETYVSGTEHITDVYLASLLYLGLDQYNYKRFQIMAVEKVSQNGRTALTVMNIITDKTLPNVGGTTSFDLDAFNRYPVVEDIASMIWCVTEESFVRTKIVTAQITSVVSSFYNSYAVAKILSIADITGKEGAVGPRGPQGEGFSIYKTYSSIDAMKADKANVPVGKLVLIASSEEDPDNAKLYVRDNSTTGFKFLTDMSGAQGIKGDAGYSFFTYPHTIEPTTTSVPKSWITTQGRTLQVGDLIMSTSSSTVGAFAKITSFSGSSAYIDYLGTVRGERGYNGSDGNSIREIVKTSSIGLVDYYRVYYTNTMDYDDFTVTNGNGILSIEKTSTSGLVDTYTITLADGTTTTFTVTNGADGSVSKIEIETTGDSGSMSDTDMANILDDTKNVEVVNNGQVYRLAFKSSSFYTYLNIDHVSDTELSYSAIFVNVATAAVNYGTWSREEITPQGGGGTGVVRIPIGGGDSGSLTPSQMAVLEENHYDVELVYNNDRIHRYVGNGNGYAIYQNDNDKAFGRFYETLEYRVNIQQSSEDYGAWTRHNVVFNYPSELINYRRITNRPIDIIDIDQATSRESYDEYLTAGKYYKHMRDGVPTINQTGEPFIVGESCPKIYFNTNALWGAMKSAIHSFLGTSYGKTLLTLSDGTNTYYLTATRTSTYDAALVYQSTSSAEVLWYYSQSLPAPYTDGWNDSAITNLNNILASGNYTVSANAIPNYINFISSASYLNEPVPFEVGTKYSRMYFDTSMPTTKVNAMLDSLLGDDDVAVIYLGSDLCEVAAYRIYTNDDDYVNLIVAEGRSLEIIFAGAEVPESVLGVKIPAGWMNNLDTGLFVDGDLTFGMVNGRVEFPYNAPAAVVEDLPFISSQPFGKSDYEDSIIYYYDGTTFAPIKGGSGQKFEVYNTFEELPSVGENGVIYLVPQHPTGTPTNFYDEYLWIDTDSTYEKIGSTEINLDNYVRRDQYASSTDGGVVKVSSTYGFNINSANGILTAAVKTYAQYINMLQNAVIGKGTLEAVIDGKIKTKKKTFSQYTSAVVGTNVRITVTDTDVTTNTLVNLYPQNVDTETFLQDNMTTSIINESDGSFNFTVKTDLPDTFAAYYTITEVI